jgi:two-component system nitrogen regulation sensor histidine kinase NtrY
MLSTVASRLASPLLLAAGGTAFAASTGRDWVTAFAAGLLLGVGSALWMRKSRREAAVDLAPTPEIAARRLHEHVVAAIADSNPDAVVFFSDTGNIRYANPTARELFFDGVSPEGQNFLRLMATAPLPLREALLGESDRLFNIEIEGQRETFHVSRRTFLLDEELHTLLIVKHLTREISRREVDVLKRVIRVISHEVNNSLAPVSSLVHSARKIAQGPEPGAKLGRVFDTIEERTRHLASFLEGYANLARLPEPRMRRIEWEPFLRQLAELHPGVRLPEPPGLPGYFDPVQVEQLLINLFKNAVEAGSEREGVELAVRVDENGDVELRVRDRGPGFSEEALKSALLPLYTTKERGSGMGLALCREIAEAHGGSIGLGNDRDGGGWVVIRLPGRRRDDSSRMTRSRLTLTRG